MELIIGLVVLVVVYLTGAVHGWNARERKATRVLDEFAKQLEERLGEETKNVIHITVEEHDGILFVYDKSNHNFMAQGSTPSELEDNLQKRFPGKKFACSQEHMQILKASV